MYDDGTCQVSHRSALTPMRPSATAGQTSFAKIFEGKDEEARRRILSRKEGPEEDGINAFRMARRMRNSDFDFNTGGESRRR